MAPDGEWLSTCRDGEVGTNVSALRIAADGTREWVEAGSGRTTVTHPDSFAAPTHWKTARPVGGEHHGSERHRGRPWRRGSQACDASGRPVVTYEMRRPASAIASRSGPSSVPQARRSVPQARRSVPHT